MTSTISNDDGAGAIATSDASPKSADDNLRPGRLHRLIGNRLLRYLVTLGVALAVWVVVYRLLNPFSRWFAFDLLRLDETSRIGSAVQFFVYDTPKVLMLLVLIVFFVGIIRPTMSCSMFFVVS